MSETERRQTTKGIWMSKNKKDVSDGDGPHAQKMAENILVMDVEGTDGRERGEDQDFERKSALFALATSEVLIVNIWEHQVGLYQGANMGLLKTVFEVNLQLFLKDKQYAFPPIQPQLYLLTGSEQIHGHSYSSLSAIILGQRHCRIYEILLSKICPRFGPPCRSLQAWSIQR